MFWSPWWRCRGSTYPKAVEIIRVYLWRECVREADGGRGWCGGGKERRPAVLVGGHSGCQIQLFWGGERDGNGGGVVTGSTGGYWWLWSDHRQWVPCKSEGGRERRGKAGDAEERPVGTETEELDHEDSVGPWPLFPRRKREIRGGSEKRRTEWAVMRGECKSLSSGEATTRPSAAGARWLEDIILRRAESVARRMRQRSTCGFGARPSRRRDGGPDSERVTGSWWRRPSGPQSYSEVPEVKHNKNCTSKTTSSSSGPAQYALRATLGHFLFIYINMFYTQIWQHMQHSITQSTACGST